MYTEFYGLKAEPFLLTPDHRFYFESQVHEQAMAHLMYGLSRGEGFIVITGEVGAGKTTIVQRLCATVDREKVVAAHVVTTLLTGVELLRMVCFAFKIRDVPEKKDAVLLCLQDFFEGLERAGRKALLIVDEAQNLSASALEELRMLSNFQVGVHSPCQIFLVGQPQFRDTLTHPNLEQLRQRVIASYHLGPMSRHEVGLYLPHRLKHAGWTGDPAFEDGAVDAIYVATGGVPRQINTLCSRLLLLGFLDNMHVFAAGDVERVAADLREEYRGQAVTPAPAMEENYLTRMDRAPITARLETLEGRVNHQEKSLRKLAVGLAEMIDPAARG
ncbi:putative secretion ATPase (PEP-CTERM system associated) [Rhizomicrobium palustre]|uniref:Putative secretion ATPase (PEP-CTERM system associated) n=1 Tax=Rhizomicrobium palustre TaxID=189966 RepID=A0A846MTE2_9PROT|nr:XrtA/PEP-CTERM system-associated ATPase [Rhizomicrobium palustre]NIK86704.1 putative secretion ATPase (PEP-CTERM system associated) [Rhizomicrobium palustre]